MLHENLKALRKQKGLTQEELAIRLNVVRQTVSKWESGRSVPDADILLKEYVCHIHKGDVLQPVSDGHSVMGRGYFILENRGGAVKENIWKETEEGMQEEKFLRAAEIVKSAFF